MPHHEFKRLAWLIVAIALTAMVFHGTASLHMSKLPESSCIELNAPALPMPVADESRHPEWFTSSSHPVAIEIPAGESPDCARLRPNGNSLKMNDNGSVLRFETTIYQPRDFRVLRKLEE
jgi:hypothetical protein